MTLMNAMPLLRFKTYDCFRKDRKRFNDPITLIRIAIIGFEDLK